MVFIVDDDREIRTALSCLLTAAAIRRARSNGGAVIDEQDAEAPGCLLLDVCLPGLSGLELQAALADSPRARPIVFMTGTGDIEAGVQAMKAGAVHFLTKPVEMQADSSQRSSRRCLTQNSVRNVPFAA